MLSLRLQNIRSLLDTGDLVLKPLTILVGKNNSGKSTFTRFFPLLRQSVELRSNTPVLWYGELVDFGSVNDVKSRFSGTNNIRFDFKLSTDVMKQRFLRTSRTRNLIQEVGEISFGLEMMEVRGTTQVCCAHLALDDDIVSIHIGEDGGIANATVNGIDFVEFLPRESVQIETRHLVPTFLVQMDFGEDRGRVPSSGVGGR